MHALVHTYSSTLVAEKWHQQRSTKNCSSSNGHLESISRLACVTANWYNRQFWALWLVFHLIGTLQYHTIQYQLLNLFYNNSATLLGLKVSIIFYIQSLVFTGAIIVPLEYLFYFFRSAQIFSHLCSHLVWK